MRKAPSKQKNGQGMLMKTQVPPRPSQNIENTNSQLGQRRIESSKFMPKSSSTQKIEFHIEENMTESRISEARNGLQLLKKKMSRNGKSRERQPSIERTQEVKPQSNLRKMLSQPQQTKTSPMISDSKVKLVKKSSIQVESQKAIETPLGRTKVRNEPDVEQVPIKYGQDFYALLERELQKENNISQPGKKAIVNATVVPSEYEEETQLIQCSRGCGRMFNEKAIEKHEKICEKVFQSKRKAFDSAAARQIENQTIKKPNQMSYTRTLEKPKKTVSVAPEKEKSTIPKWKLDSIRLRNMIGKNPGAVTKEEKAILEDNSGMVQCQYCSRRFNKKAAQRHIPFCETKAKEMPKIIVGKRK